MIFPYTTTTQSSKSGNSSMIQCDTFINNEFSDPIQIPPNVSIMSYREESSSDSCFTLSYVSLLSFREYFLSLPLIFINLTFREVSFFVACPSTWICQMFALLRFRLCIFSRNVTEMMLCPYCIYSHGMWSDLSHYWCCSSCSYD